MIAQVYARLDSDGNPATRWLCIEKARGGGKSSFIAALAVYALISENNRITIDVSCITVPQAHILVGYARNFAEQIGEPIKQNYASGAPPLSNKETGSKLRTVVASVQAMQGAAPLIAIIDEVSHIPHRVLSQAFTGRAKVPNGMVITTTTPDPDRTRPYYHPRDIAAADLLAGELDPGTVLLSWSADENDAIENDPALFEKANPGLPLGLPPLDGLQQNYRTLYEQGNANERSIFIREHLNRFDDNISTFLDMNDWDACAGVPEFPEGSKVYIGLDLSRGGESEEWVTTDVCSICMLRLDKGVAHVAWRNFLVDFRIDLHERLRAMPFTSWADDGHLTLIPGKHIDPDYISAHIEQAFEDFEVVEIGLDVHYNPDVRAKWTELNRWPVTFQGSPLKISTSCGWLQDMVRARKVVHSGCPLMRGSLKTVKLRHRDRLVYPLKNGTEVTDPLMALLHAAGSAHDHAATRVSMYESEDFAI